MNRFKPGEEIKGMYWKMDAETQRAIREAVHSMDPEYLDMLASNPTFIQKIAKRLGHSGRGMAPMPMSPHGAAFHGSTTLGERMHESIDEEEGFTLPPEEMEDYQSASEGADPYWHSERPPVAPMQEPADASGDWTPPPRPIIPVDQRAEYVRGMSGLGEEEAKPSKLGQNLLYLSAGASLVLIVLNLLKGQTPAPIISAEESRALRNSDEDDGPIFPYDKSLSVGKNPDALYGGNE